MRATYSVFILLIVFLLMLPFSGLAQNFNADDYVITNYSMDEGLPQNSINAIEQSNDGYIWLATFSGLVRFDGKNFKTFNTINTPCLISDEFFDFFISSDNSIWLLSSTMNTVVTKFNDGLCENYKIADGIGGPINFMENDDGIIWINTEGKSFKFTGIEFQQVLPITEGDIVENAIKSSKAAWFGLKENLYRIYDGVPVLVHDNIPYEDSDYIYVWDHPSKDRTILLGTTDSIIEYEYNNEVFRKQSYSLPFKHFLDLKFDDLDNQFAITAGGVALKSGNEFIPFEPFGDQSDIRIKSILHDNEGNYWIGTDGDGLFRFRKKFISMIDSEVGLENEKMLSITKLKNGKMLFSTNCSGIYEWDDGQANLSKVHDFLPMGCYWAVFQDSKGRMWYGAGEPYMAEGYNKPVIKFGNKQGFDGYAIFAFKEDKKGDVWVASSRGIYVYNGTELIRKITEEDGLYYNDSRVMFEDDDSTMWVGTNGGLHTIKDYKVSRIPLIEESGSEFNDQPYIRAIHKDKDGMYWIGTYGDGLFRIKEGEVFRFTVEQGLFDNTASHIIEDKNGFLWMGSNRGIHRVSRDQLNAVAEGDMKEVVSYSYGTLDGMNSPETNGGFQPSYIVEENGDFYLPTVAGVVKVSVDDVRINEVPPPVYIELVKNNKGEILNSEDLRLSHDNAFINIGYTAINFSNSDKVQFKYRIKGLNDDWVEAGANREAIYTKIPPGDYVFEVIASNEDGVWNNEGASMSIAVIPPFWQRPWFISILIGLLIGAGYMAFKIRTNLLLEENEKQKKLTEQLIQSQEIERKRIAAELHDGLGQQILVIKNRAELAKLQLKDNPDITEQLNEIEHSALRSIEDVRNISHALRPVMLEKFGLKDALIELCEQVQRSTSIEWSFHIDDINELIPKGKQINFYRVIQESIQNILKHSNATEASVMVRIMDGKINTLVFDNGKGFDKSSMVIKKGLGFLGMKERIENLGGTIIFESVPNEETVLKIHIPVNKYL